ncbi:MAG: FAD:protein FMN transferase [Pseudomonadota bacterium]
MPPRLGATALRTLTGTSMGTRWAVKILSAAATADAATRAIATALAEVVEQMSTWEAGSHISRFNRAAAGSWHPLPDAFARVLTCALAWAEASGGAFDPTVGPLVDAWGFGPRPGDDRSYAGAVPPQEAAVAAARAHAGWQRLRFDAAAGQLWQPGGARLDLSGIAKGFAVDQVCAALSACGVQDFLVEIGGELRARGHRPDGGDWAVGIEQAGGGAPLPLPLRDGAVATSGATWHAFTHGGRRYAHTIDPRSGAPVVHGLASVTVVHARCMEADAIATALLVLGPEAGPVFARRHGIAAWFVERDGEDEGAGEGGSRDGRYRGHASPAFAALLA